MDTGTLWLTSTSSGRENSILVYLSKFESYSVAYATLIDFILFYVNQINLNLKTSESKK